jgi:MFS transporter, Spinster family, sphingosine-1-phosphate transporter
MTESSITKRQAYWALALLFGVNFLNYIDRYVIAAVAPLIQAEFSLRDTQLGLIGSMFMVAYMVASPFTGVAGDRWPRRYLVGTGVLVWSLATVLSGLATSYHHLLLARSVIGFGEAGFGVVSPTLISDLFSRERRGRMLSFFYVAIPVGSALGFLLGGYVGQRYGWRAAFFVAGAPGLLLGLLAFRMHEPARGAGDGASAAHQHQFDLGGLRRLLSNQSFVYTTLGMAAMTFALGGMAYWMPTFFARVRGLPLDDANALFGGITVAAGLVGTFLGGWLGDWLLKRTDRAYLLVSGVGMLLGVPAAYVGLTSPDRAVYLPAIFVAEVMVFLNTGPANAVLVSVVMPEIRASAIALSIFVFHLLGDVPSPILIGKASDWTGSLEKALLLTTVAMGASGIFYLLGTRTLGRDTERVLETVRAREARGAAEPSPA